MTQPANKNEYLELSRQHSISARCPILARCMRRAITLALADDSNIDDASERLDQSPIVHIIGEGPGKVGGNNNFYVSGACPEVCAFEATGIFTAFRGKPMLRGEFDAYFRDEKYHVLETGHYSACPEFCTLSSAPVSPLKKNSWLIQHYQ